MPFYQVGVNVIDVNIYLLRRTCDLVDSGKYSSDVRASMLPEAQFQISIVAIIPAVIMFHDSLRVVDCFANALHLFSTQQVPGFRINIEDMESTSVDGDCAACVLHGRNLCCNMYTLLGNEKLLVKANEEILIIF